MKLGVLAWIFVKRGHPENNVRLIGPLSKKMGSTITAKFP